MGSYLVGHQSSEFCSEFFHLSLYFMYMSSKWLLINCWLNKYTIEIIMWAKRGHYVCCYLYTNINCINKCFVVNPVMVCNFAFLFYCTLVVGLQTLWGFDLKTYLMIIWEGPDALAVCQAHWGLPVGFLLLRYLVLFTVESLSLLYLLFIPWFI